MLYLVRHGETPWTLTKQHTGRTDLHLTNTGRIEASGLKPVLAGVEFAEVWCSPLIRARETCQLAGFGERAEIMPELAEWDYGQFEGLTRSEIFEKHPGWLVFKDGCPGGESVEQVYARAERVVSRAKAVQGDVLVFSSAHISRVIAACWLGHPAEFAKHLMLHTGSISCLADEHGMPAIRFWNFSYKT